MAGRPARVFPPAVFFHSTLLETQKMRPLNALLPNLAFRWRFSWISMTVITLEISSSLRIATGIELFICSLFPPFFPFSFRGEEKKRGIVGEIYGVATQRPLALFGWTAGCQFVNYGTNIQMNSFFFFFFFAVLLPRHEWWLEKSPKISDNISSSRRRWIIAKRTSV